MNVGEDAALDGADHRAVLSLLGDRAVECFHRVTRASLQQIRVDGIEVAERADGCGWVAPRLLREPPARGGVVTQQREVALHRDRGREIDATVARLLER